MWKKRSFKDDNISKLDKLLHYLFKTSQNYTFHTDVTKTGETVYSVFWFEQSRYS